MLLSGSAATESMLTELHDPHTKQPQATVSWEGRDDPANPRNWPATRKWTIAACGYVFCGLVSMSVSSYSIAVPSIQDELDTSHELAVVGLSLYTYSIAFAPLILSPTSEAWGRRPVYLASAIGFFIFQLPQAIAPNIQTMLVVRFISGIAGSTGISIIGGTLADLFNDQDRGLAMAWFAFAAFAPTGLGPVALGYLAMQRSFRLVFWVMFALSGLFSIIAVWAIRETRESVLLSHKAQKLRKETGNADCKSQADIGRVDLLHLIKLNLSRPYRLFLSEPILDAFTLWIAFAWGVVYLLLLSIPIVYQEVYSFNLGQTGLVYTTQIIAAFAGLGLTTFTEKLYIRDVERKGPEARLWNGMVGGVLFAVGCWWYTWGAWPHIHWIVPAVGLVILYTGILLVYLCVFSYLTDCYTYYAASALAVMNFWRNIMAASFPLFGRQIYDKLGIHATGSIIAGIATILAILPFLCYHHGAKLREKSRTAVT